MVYVNYCRGKSSNPPSNPGIYICWEKKTKGSHLTREINFFFPPSSLTAHGSLSLSLSLFTHPHGSLSLSLIIHSLTCTPSRDASSGPPMAALYGDNTRQLISIGGKDLQLQIHNPLSSRQPILSRCQAISVVHLR